MNFRQFLEYKFIEWQQQQGGRKTVGEFAEYVEIDRTNMINVVEQK